MRADRRERRAGRGCRGGGGGGGGGAGAHHHHHHHHHHRLAGGPLSLIAETDSRVASRAASIYGGASLGVATDDE